MKYILFFFFLFYVNANSQNLAAKEIDKVFKINLPENKLEIDTLNYKLIVCSIAKGKLLLLNPKENPDINIHNKKELISSYKAFQRGLLKGLKGELIIEETIKLNGILIERMNFKSMQNNILQYIDSYAFYLKNKYYNLQFWRPENSDTEFDKQKIEILNSISFPSNLSLKDQFSKK